MVSNPFAEGMSVEVGSDTDQLESGMASAIGSVGKLNAAVIGLGGAMTALAAGGFAASINAARSFETAMVEVEKVTSPSVAREMGSAIREMSQTIPVATNKLAGVAATAGRLGVRGVKNIKEFTQVTSEMAVATDLTAQKAATSFGRLTTLLELPISKVRELGSAINELSNTMALTSSELVDSVLRSSAALNQLGLQTDQILALNGALIEVSASARRAGTRLRSLAQSLMQPSKLRDLGSALLDAGKMTQFLGDQGKQLQQEWRDAQASVRSANQAFRAEKAELRSLQEELRKTDAELEGLGDQHDEFGDKLAENRIKIQEIRLEARKEGRELTESEKQRVEELQVKNDELRLSQAKLGRKMDDTREKREEQQEAIDAQKQSVDKAKQSVEAEKAEAKEAQKAVVKRFQAIVKENPYQSILDLAGAMKDGGETASILNENLSRVANQALAGLGQNLPDTRKALKEAKKQLKDGGSLSKEFETALGTLNNQLQLLWNRLRDVAIQIGKRLLPPLTKLVKFVQRGVSAFSKLNEKTDGMLGVVSLLATGIAGLALVVGGLVSALPSLGLLSGVAGGLGTIAGAALSLLGPVGLVIGAVAALGLAFSKYGDEIMEIVGKAVGFIESALRDAAQWLIANAPGLIKKGFKAIGKGIRFVMIDLYNAITGNKKSYMRTIIVDAAAWLIENGDDIIVEAFKLVIDGIIAAFQGLYDGLIGKSLIPDLIRDIGKAITNWNIGKIFSNTLGDVFKAFKGLVSDLASGKVLGKFGELGRKFAQAHIDAFNAVLPDVLSIPSVSIAGQTFGGDSIDIPQLQSGGLVESGGFAQLHAGERVVPAAQVDGGGGSGAPRIETVEVHATTEAEGAAAARGFTDELRSHGFRL